MHSNFFQCQHYRDSTLVSKGLSRSIISKMIYGWRRFRRGNRGCVVRHASRVNIPSRQFSPGRGKKGGLKISETHSARAEWEETRERGRGDEGLFSLPPIRDPRDQRAREQGNGRECFISERRKCRWWQQAIDPGNDRGAAAVLVAGRARGDDFAAPGCRCQATRGEHAAAARRCQHPHPAGDTRFRDEVSRYRSLLRYLRFNTCAWYGKRSISVT